MPPRLVLVALLAIASGAIACGLGVVGSATELPPLPDAATDAEDATARDAEVAETASDASLGPKCDGGVYADPLTVLDASAWIILKDTTNLDYPKIATSAEGPAVSLVLPGAFASLGSIWLEPTVAFKAFDVSFRYLMTCPDAGGCSDGIAVAWLDTTDPAALQTYTSTATFGLPPGVRGGAVAFDVHQDVATGDPAAPSIALLAPDGGVAGAYDWHTKSVGSPPLAGAHDVSVRVRQGVAEVKLDGNVVLAGAVSTGFTGRFGIAASSGAQLGSFAIRSFAATFYACDDP